MWLELLQTTIKPLSSFISNLGMADGLETTEVKSWPALWPKIKLIMYTSYIHTFPYISVCNKHPNIIFNFKCLLNMRNMKMSVKEKKNKNLMPTN